MRQIKFVEVKYIQLKNGKYEAQAIDENATPLDYEEDLTWGELEEAMERLKSDNYHASDYIREFLSTSDVVWTNEYKWIEKGEEFELSSGEKFTPRWFEWHCQLQRGNAKTSMITWSTSINDVDAEKPESPRIPLMEEVIAEWFDNTMSIWAYGNEENALNRFIEWADIEKDSTTQADLPQLYKQWQKAWELREAIEEIFSEKEINKIHHAIQEGRLH